MTDDQRVYAASFISLVVGVRLDADDIDAALLTRVFRELSRCEELENPIRDTWGNWDWPFGESHFRGETQVPHLDLAIANWWSASLLNRPELNLAPRWPDGKPFALVLSHDVDRVSHYYASVKAFRQRWQAISASRRGLGRAADLGKAAGKLLAQPLFRARGQDPLWHFEDWLALEAEHGFRSTFYFFPSPLSRPHAWDCTYQFDEPVAFRGERTTVAGMMRAIAVAGWDVGLHGSYHSALDPSVFTHDKRCIEAVTGRPVVSTRQHYLHYDVDVTPRVHAAAGIQSDSTQGFNRNVGFRAGTSYPYRCWDHQAGTATTVLEIPQHVMDGGLFTPNALELDEGMAVRQVTLLMDRVQAVGGCLSLSWHPHYLNNPVWWRVYAAALAEGARRNAWGCSSDDLERWWSARATSVLGGG